MGRMILSAAAVYAALVLDTAADSIRSGAEPCMLAVALTWCMSLRRTTLALVAVAAAAVVCDVQATTPPGTHVIPLVLMTWIVRGRWSSWLTERMLLRCVCCGVVAAVLIAVPVGLQWTAASPASWRQLPFDAQLAGTRLLATVAACLSLESTAWLGRRAIFGGGSDSSKLANRWNMLTH
jgi:hypothetical protein